MGRRSSGYCLKIIACGSSESADTDIDASSQNKGSHKRGWSFRKRSTGHKELANTIITETPSENKNLEPVIINYEAPVSAVSEKPFANQRTEESPRVSTSTTKGNTVNAASNLVAEAADEDEIQFDSSLDESSIIVIQSAVRKNLAQRELIRYKEIVKLQAAVRGHLVRCRAAGTLRCIQSIVKMQALVRARHADVSLGKASTRKKGKQDSRTVSHPTYISIEKLLSNRFAIQLLESTPRTKQINIKCDPSKDDPSWKWLERWTSVSSPQLRDTHEPKRERGTVIDTNNQIENTVFEQKSGYLSDESNHSNNGPEKPNRQSKRAAFIAAQSRFEELTSNKSLTSINSLNKKHGIADKSQTVDLAGPPVYESLKLGHSRTAGSECGTELSVTSMLDSPDPSEAGNIESNKESKPTELTHSVSNLLETYDYNTSNEHIELEPETGRRMCKSSIHKEPESPITPSSQISNNKNAKKVPTKPKAWSNSTKSTVSSNHGSGLRNGLDHLPRESKPTNRRNSFGSQSSEAVVDQEPRDSCSSNSLPSYMQITESAKAKALVNISPRSSPDLHGKEGYLKKRHSLPGSVSGRHGSPRVRRSPQQTSKGNNNPERKWQN